MTSSKPSLIESVAWHMPLTAVPKVWPLTSANASAWPCAALAPFAAAAHSLRCSSLRTILWHAATMGRKLGSCSEMPLP